VPNPSHFRHNRQISDRKNLITRVNYFQDIFQLFFTADMPSLFHGRHAAPSASPLDDSSRMEASQRINWTF